MFCWSTQLMETKFRVHIRPATILHFGIILEPVIFESLLCIISFPSVINLAAG